MLDPNEEQQFAELKKLAKKLHIPIPEAFLTLEVFDKNGKLIQRHRQRSHSWVRNAYNMIFSSLAAKNVDDVTFGAGKLSYKKTDGAGYNAEKCGGNANDVDGTISGYRAAAGEDGEGILVGSGTNAESFEDFVLQTQIVDGTGANELSHVESEAHVVTYADTTLTNTLVRYFNNNTVGETSVDVNEVALVYHEFAGATPLEVLFSRDVLASTVTVPSTGQLKVTYTISLVYPS